MKHLVVLAVMAALVSSCGGTAPVAPVAQAPVIVTQVVTQVVTRVVVKQATVIVTETPQPATPTTKVAPTATTEPTAIPEPEITAQTTRAGSILGGPDEAQFNAIASYGANTTVTVVYRGGQWFAVEDAEKHLGWVYKDWINLPADRAADIPLYPEPYVLVIGKIVQQDLSGNTLFKGKVLNIGGKTAKNVVIEIETFDSGGNRSDLVRGYTSPSDLGTDEESSFETITQFDYSTFKVSVLTDT